MLRRDRFLCFAQMVAVAVSLFFGRSASAQQGTAVLTGTVVDAADKKPVADCVVTATSPSAQGEQMVVTDSAGLYRIPGLPLGTYTVRAEKETYKPYRRRHHAARRHDHPRQRGALARSVEGRGSHRRRACADGRRRIEHDRAPASRRSSRSAFPCRAPAPKARPTARSNRWPRPRRAPSNDTYGTSISGTTSPENQYVLDGMSVNNPAYGIVGTPLSMEFIKEVNVISGGYMPEYGRATGGMLNVVTKSGSNEFHGVVFALLHAGRARRQAHARRAMGRRCEPTQELSVHR